MRKILLATAACVALSGCTKEESNEAIAQESLKQPEKSASVKARKPETPKVPTKWDGPLGVKMGLSITDLSAAGIDVTPVENVPLVYRANKAPAPSSSFDDYVYLVSDEVGLCRIMAWTPEKESNQFGEQLVSTFDELQSALTEKYGKPKEYKFVQRGSIWNERRDFMMGLAKEERTHASAWQADAKHELPQDVESIVLSATAFSSSKGAVKLTYEFKNMDACIKESKQKKHSNL